VKITYKDREQDVKRTFQQPKEDRFEAIRPIRIFASEFSVELASENVSISVKPEIGSDDHKVLEQKSNGERFITYCVSTSSIAFFHFFK
jgi:hypothetical protein